LFDLNNIIRTGKSQLYFDVSDVDFNFISSLFGPGPLISDNDLTKYSYPEDPNKSDTNFVGNTNTVANGYELLKTYRSSNVPNDPTIYQKPNERTVNDN
jgi:hypothetical protein